MKHVSVKSYGSINEEDREVSEGEREGVGGCTDKYGFGTCFFDNTRVDFESEDEEMDDETDV